MIKEALRDAHLSVEERAVIKRLVFEDIDDGSIIMYTQSEEDEISLKDILRKLPGFTLAENQNKDTRLKGYANARKLSLERGRNEKEKGKTI